MCQTYLPFIVYFFLSNLFLVYLFLFSPLMFSLALAPPRPSRVRPPRPPPPSPPATPSPPRPLPTTEKQLDSRHHFQSFQRASHPSGLCKKIHPVSEECKGVTNNFLFLLFLTTSASICLKNSGFMDTSFWRFSPALNACMNLKFPLLGEQKISALAEC